MNWELLTQYITQETTPAQNAEVEKWLDEKPANKALLKQLQNKHQQLNQPLKEEAVHQEWVKLLDRIIESPATDTQSSSVKMFWGLGIAATVLLTSLLTWISIKSASHAPQAYTILKTSVKQRREFKLPDGSIAYLGPNTQLKVSPGFGSHNRAVYLTGEAFFDVQHRTGQPFIITTANHMKVNVLGTSFNVYSKDNTEEVKVSTGLVGVIVNGRTHLIKAGEGVVYAAAEHKTQKISVDARDAASLQNGILYFNNSSVTDIAGKIERYYNVQIEVLASASARPRFSGQMKDNGIHNLLEDLAFATGLHYRIKNENRIILY